MQLRQGLAVTRDRAMGELMFWMELNKEREHIARFFTRLDVAGKMLHGRSLRPIISALPLLKAQWVLRVNILTISRCPVPRGSSERIQRLIFSGHCLLPTARLSLIFFPRAGTEQSGARKREISRSELKAMTDSGYI